MIDIFNSKEKTFRILNNEDVYTPTRNDKWALFLMGVVSVPAVLINLYSFLNCSAFWEFGLYGAAVLLQLHVMAYSLALFRAFRRGDRGWDAYYFKYKGEVIGLGKKSYYEMQKMKRDLDLLKAKHGF